MGWVSWRGLWDRFAEPRSAAAYIRSLSKGVPCFIDTRGTANETGEILAATLESATSVPVYVAIESRIVLRDLASRFGERAPLRFVELSEHGPWSILRIKGGALAAAGRYFPFPLLPEADGGEGHVVVECADVLVTRAGRHRYARRLRAEDSRELALRARAWGDDWMWVSDLVEHHQLLAAQGRVP